MEACVSFKLGHSAEKQVLVIVKYMKTEFVVDTNTCCLNEMPFSFTFRANVSQVVERSSQRFKVQIQAYCLHLKVS